MSRKKTTEEPLTQYVAADEAAHILSMVNERTIRVDYVPKMRKSKKYQIRTMKYGRYYLYHKDDLRHCLIRKLSGQRPLLRKN